MVLPARRPGLAELRLRYRRQGLVASVAGSSREFRDPSGFEDLDFMKHRRPAHCQRNAAGRGDGSESIIDFVASAFGRSSSTGVPLTR